MAETATDGLVYLEPYIDVVVEGESGISKNLRIAVDTGFNGWLALPGESVEELNLTFLGERSAIQADGRKIPFEIYSALVSWHGENKKVLAPGLHKKGGTPLVGSLLEHSRLAVDVEADGAVSITEIPKALD